MTSAAFDTLQAAQTLQEAGIERGQAEAIAHIVGLSGADYATKADLAALEARLEAKIENLAAHLEAKIVNLGANLEAKVVNLGAEIETKVERAKNVIFRSILTASTAIIVTLIGGIFTVISIG